MPGIYVDTSALGRVALGEADARLIRTTLAQFDPWHASELLVVELRRLGTREGVQTTAEQLLALITLTPPTCAGLEHASQLDPVEVRALDSIHLATAIDLRATGDIGAVLTYDHQLQAGCQHHGIAVEAPVV